MPDKKEVVKGGFVIILTIAVVVWVVMSVVTADATVWEAPVMYWLQNTSVWEAAVWLFFIVWLASN
jgi:hypothetical protein